MHTYRNIVVTESRGWSQREAVEGTVRLGTGSVTYRSVLWTLKKRKINHAERMLWIKIEYAMIIMIKNMLLRIRKLVRFKSMVDVVRRTDPNMMMDEGTPTSTRGMINEIRIWGAIEIPLKLRIPRKKYKKQWGAEYLNEKSITWTWDLMVEDVYEKPTVLKFELVEGKSPLIIGLDVKRYEETLNRVESTRIVFRRPSDTSER